jgi:hypothetical protein
MFRFRHRQHFNTDEMLGSLLYDQHNFYKAFLGDIKNCRSELVIESPFITTKRVDSLLPILRGLVKRGVTIVVNTRNPQDHDGPYQWQAEQAVDDLQNLGVLVLFTSGHHRKVAVIDREITWEGSLNILSHNDSCEIMRKIISPALSQNMIQFLRIEHYLIQFGG